MIKKIFLFTIMSMFLISFATASIANLGTFKQNECIQLIQTCPDCSYNNITTVTFPNSTLALDTEVLMDKDDTFYNYTFCNTGASGRYNVNGFGNPGGAKLTWNYYLDVTPTGVIQGSIFENSVLIFMVILSLMFIGFGIYFRIAGLGFMGSILMVLSGVYTMIYGFNNVTDLYTRSVAGTLLGLGMIVMIISAYEWSPWVIGEDSD